MRIQALHCPACGGPLEVAPGASRAACAYCGASLVIDHERITDRTQRPASPERAEAAPYPQPPATLYTYSAEGSRFELSVVEQELPERVPDHFTPVDLGEHRFALAYLRAIDPDGAAAAADLSAAFAALRASLDEDGDPGLAANLALEAVCQKGFALRLECAVLLFEPRLMTMTGYAAGCRDSVVWVSSEEGRSIVPGGDHAPLERKMLRESRDYFSNMQPIRLAASDLVVFTSAGYAGRGKGLSSTSHGLFNALNEHLGEEPLRIVTLAKNAFWEGRSRHDAPKPPCGDVKVAAVRAVLPAQATSLDADDMTELFRSRRFEVALRRGPRDAARLCPLHNDRQVVVWLSPVEGELTTAQVDAACQAVLAVLDRPDHGDNDNPRAAGRAAYQALGLKPAQLRMAVIQLFDEYERVKYFRGGWKQPLSLGPRGVRSDGQQQFDEGGDATVHQGCRLFFPGLLPYENQCTTAEQLAQVWFGGKASRLYEALASHWKTKRTEAALEKLALAAASDLPGPATRGFGLVSGV